MKSTFRFIKRIILLMLALVLAYQLWLFGTIVWWKWNNPDETSFMSIRLNELQKKNPKAKLQHQWVPYEKISINLKRAVVASEDDKFMDHNGFDWAGIEYALNKNQRKGKRVAGGSTITQQLAKNLFLSPSRSYIRKAEEAVIALMIELVWDKRRILEVYLNVVEWGNGLFGAEIAARHYYNMPASSLDESQAARLAVMLPSPRRFERRMPAYVLTHAQSVQSRMKFSDVPR